MAEIRRFIRIWEVIRRYIKFIFLTEMQVKESLEALILLDLWDVMCWIYITFTTVFKKSLNMNMTTKEVRTLK